MQSLFGTKKGMTQIFDEAGSLVPVSVIEAGPCVVTQLKTKEKDGYNAIQVGYGQARKLNKPRQGHLKGAKVKYLSEIRVVKPEEYKLGQEIKVEIFKPGDSVSVSGVSIGKGFQGAIKRFHHARGPMSHGSKCHRLPGSIGAGTTPGRVYKGLEMAGRMGGGKVTVKNLKVVEVDAAKNLLLLKGAVPGKEGNTLLIRKTSK
jgi:large subunit ribosomal protein L3